MHSMLVFISRPSPSPILILYLQPPFTATKELTHAVCGGGIHRWSYGDMSIMLTCSRSWADNVTQRRKK